MGQIIGVVGRCQRLQDLPGGSGNGGDRPRKPVYSLNIEGLSVWCHPNGAGEVPMVGQMISAVFEARFKQDDDGKFKRPSFYISSWEQVRMQVVPVGGVAAAGALPAAAG